VASHGVGPDGRILGMPEADIGDVLGQHDHEPPKAGPGRAAAGRR
jgi:hypothetical protein